MKLLSLIVLVGTVLVLGKVNTDIFPGGAHNLQDYYFRGILPADIKELLNNDAFRDLNAYAKEKFRRANPEYWDTKIFIQNTRADGSPAVVAAFDSYVLEAGSFWLKVREAEAEVSLSPHGIPGKSFSSDYHQCSNSVKESIREAIDKLTDLPEATLRKELEKVTPTAYMYRNELLCANFRVIHEPLVVGVTRTEKYLNVLVPFSALRVHLLNPGLIGYKGSGVITMIDESQLMGKRHLGNAPVLSSSSGWRFAGFDYGNLVISSLEETPADLRKIVSDKLTTTGSPSCSLNFLSREKLNKIKILQPDHIHYDTGNNKRDMTDEELFNYGCGNLAFEGTLVLVEHVNETLDGSIEYVNAAHYCQRDGWKTIAIPAVSQEEVFSLAEKWSAGHRVRVSDIVDSLRPRVPEETPEDTVDEFPEDFFSW